MHAYHWIVLALAICSQWGIHATADEEDPADLAGQEEFLASQKNFKWALKQLEPGTTEYPVSHLTYPIVMDALNAAKDKWNDRLLPEYQAVYDKYLEVGWLCNDFGTPCPEWSTQFMDTNKKFPELFSYLSICAHAQKERCPDQYRDILLFYGEIWIKHFEDIGARAKSKLLNMLGMGRRAEESSDKQE